MTLSIYDPVKGCFVLAPMKPMTINAFHPDYVKTYHPDFMKQFRTMEANRKSAEALSKHVTEVRKTKPTHGFVTGVSKPKLSPREFHIYQRAGAPK